MFYSGSELFEETREMDFKMEKYCGDCDWFDPLY